MSVIETGLGNQAMLSKIDKLRELNVGSLIPLPQVIPSTPPRASRHQLTFEKLVVVGDQSSGKSSVLESLTGFSFPRAAGLCTRYATQITCCRDATTSVIISIIPRPNADEELKMKLLGFLRRIDGELDNAELASIFHEVSFTLHIPFARLFANSPQANDTMGIRMKTDEMSESGAFSQDILKIEVHGPKVNPFLCSPLSCYANKQE